MTNVILDRTGPPSSVWLLALMYVAFVLNHTWSHNIKNVPLTALLGITVDISVLLRYHFWQQVYFIAIEPGFPSDSKERLGHIVGISQHVGHTLTWKILDVETNKSSIAPFVARLLTLPPTFVSHPLVGRALQYAPTSNQKLLIPIWWTRPMSPILMLTTQPPSSMVNLLQTPSLKILPTQLMPSYPLMI